MRFSSYYIPTLKQTPADAEVASHKLLLRAGMMRQLASGVYIYLPLGLRLIDKIARVVREEMVAAGFCELLMPMAQPGDLWKESGRWEKYGKELLRFKDRKEADFCLGPTHEEIITNLARQEIHSYRQLPLRLFQIQTKFRDEARPRFGLMRGREFLMKDAYSFDASQSSAEESYKLMFDAYMRIFGRLGLDYRPVEADTGSIGGNFSHEFMVMADAGEDVIALCDQCEYAANVEKAEVKWQGAECADACPKIEPVPTPGKHTVEAVASMLGLGPEKLVKTMLFSVDGAPVAALVRGDRQVNEIKLKKFLEAEKVELAPQPVVESITKAPLGFAGPVGLNIPVYADMELAGATDYVTGANMPDTHLLHVDLRRDVDVRAWTDLRQIETGDPCPRCGAPVRLTRGIEVGHVFMLGMKYSEVMRAFFQDEDGREKCMISGCYGIGVSRVAAAAIEQSHDSHGIVFNPAISPFDCMLLNLDPRDGKVCEAVESLEGQLEALGLEVLVDDRQERPGVKFNDADLLGFPVQIALGAKSLARNVAECKDRRTGEKTDIPLENFREDFEKWRAGVIRGWKERRRPQ